MLGITDVTAIVTVIGSVSAAVVSIIIALRQTETKAAVHDIQHQVATPNSTTLGEIVAANDLTGNTPASTPKVEP